MFKSKYIKSLATTVVLASALFMSTEADAAKNFTDLNADPSHAQSVAVLNSYDVFDYKEGNKLNGSAPVSRAEVAKVLHNLFEDSIPAERKYSNNLKDVNPNTKFYEDIVWAYESKIFDGDNNGNFNPNQTLTRAQMAKVLVNAFLLETDGTYKFKDVSTNHWAYEYINILGAEGFSIGSNGNFMPEQKVTLNQLSTFIWRIDGKPAMATTTPVATEVEDNVEFATYEEVKQMAIDLFNNRGTEEQRITVYTKEDVGTKFHEYMSSDNYDFTEDLKGYTRNFGFDLSVSSWEVDGKDYYETVIRLDYNITTDEETYIKFLDKTEDAVAYIKANYDTSNDYNKVKAVAEFLASQMTYNQPIPADHPYLYEAGMVWCEDYVDAATVLLNALGLETRYLTGKADNGVTVGGHAWNAVKVDGNWYYTDVTTYDTDSQVNNEKRLLMAHQEYDFVIQHDSSFRATNTPYNK